MSIHFFPIKLLLCLLCGISTVIGDEYDYTQVDYCAKEMECNGVKNTGCGCKFNPGINEYTQDWNDFRQIMVDLHNQYREYLASGKEKNNSLDTGASNMNVVNYNLELEHLSRCWLMSEDGPTGKNYHDKCRRTKAFRERAGQNLCSGTLDSLIKKRSDYHLSIQYFYNEVTLVNQSIIDKYVGCTDPNPKMHWGHFTELVWAICTHIGCAKGCTTVVTKGKGPKGWCALACDYSVKDDDVNCFGEPVYKTGKGCSACEQGRKCNPKYTSLCGELEPVPTDSLKPLPGQPPIPTSAPATTTEGTITSAGGDGGSNGGGGGSAEGGGGSVGGGEGGGGGGFAADGNTTANNGNDSTTIKSTKSNTNKHNPSSQIQLVIIVFVCLLKFLMAF